MEGMKNQMWVWLGLIAGAFALVLIVRQPVHNLPTSFAGPLAESQAAFNEAAAARDDFQTFANETEIRFQALERQYQQLNQQRPAGRVPSFYSDLGPA